MADIFGFTDVVGIVVASLALLLIVLTSGRGSDVNNTETGF